ncbi:hypothetical protein D9M72_401610 [compost metagenome]
MRRVRAVGLVLVDEGRSGVLVHAGATELGGAGQDHEVGRAAFHEARVVRLQRDEDDVVAALGDQVQAMVEELPEEGHPGIERRRQAGVRRDVGNEESLCVIPRAEQPVEAGTGHDLGAILEHIVWGTENSIHAGVEGRRDCRRVIGGLIDDQVADDAWLGVDHRPAGLRVGRATIGRPEHRIQQAREEVVRGAELALAGEQVVERTIHGAQAEGHLHVGQQVTELLAIGMGFGDENLLKDEIQVRKVEIGHFADSSIPTA